MLEISGKRFFKPQEIADLRLIVNSMGKGDNRFVLKLIKDGTLKAVQTNVSEVKPYYAVSEDEIVRYNRKFNPNYKLNLEEAK